MADEDKWIRVGWKSKGQEYPNCRYFYPHLWKGGSKGEGRELTHTEAADKWASEKKAEKYEVEVIHGSGSTSPFIADRIIQSIRDMQSVK